MQGEVSLIDFERDKLEAALRSILGGTATLFAGAGVSFLSKNASGMPLPNGNGLSDVMHDKLGIDRRKHGLASIAEYYRLKNGSNGLADLLTISLSAVSTDQRLIEFYNQPWRRIYTTNYDNVISNSRKSRRSQIFSHNDQPQSVMDGAVVHLNGHLGQVEPHSVDDELTLTDFSYGTTNLTGSSWMELFLSDIRLSKSLIFIGYSLLDLDIARAVIGDERIKKKTFIFVGPDSDDVEISRLRKYGTVSNEGIEYLFEKFEKAKKTFVLPPPENKLLHAVELVAGAEESTKPAAAILFDQLVYGEIPIGEILAGRNAAIELPFLVERTDIAEAMSTFLSGGARDMFITGELASGKTMGLVQIAKAALESGYRVFWLNDGRNFERDLAAISQIDDDVLVVSDGYVSRLEALKTYIKTRRPRHRLVLAERTATHELIRLGLENEPNFGPVREVTLTRLSPAEGRGFERLVHFAGLWGDNAGLSPAGREKLIMSDLESSLYRILLEVIKSQKVQNEIKLLLEPILKDDESLRFFVTAFIVNIFSYNFWAIIYLTKQPM